MPDRILSPGILSAVSAATVLAALFFSAGQDAAQASRCPLGEIYRPSRGICVSKEKAIQAGIYHGASRMSVASAPQQAHDAQPAPKARVEARPQALAAIERRAPVSKADDALAFATERKPETNPAPVQNKPVQVVPIVFSPPARSPFGSLVALEPIP